MSLPELQEADQKADGAQNGKAGPAVPEEQIPFISSVIKIIRRIHHRSAQMIKKQTHGEADHRCDDQGKSCCK